MTDYVLQALEQLAADGVLELTVMPRLPVAEYLVMNENCLGYAYAEQPHLFNILASAIGGPHHLSTPIAMDREATRPATLADFERYRVDPKGHLPPPITLEAIKGCHMRQVLHMDGSRDRKSGWWADIHECVEHPRLRRKATYKRADRSVKTVWSVDGREYVDTLEEALAALNGPVLPPNESQFMALQEMRKRLDKDEP